MTIDLFENETYWRKVFEGVVNDKGEPWYDHLARCYKSLSFVK